MEDELVVAGDVSIPRGTGPLAAVAILTRFLSRVGLLALQDVTLLKTLRSGAV
jgi:hypothetical protein